MIRPTELRIGNYIWNPIQKLVFKVDATVLSDLYYTSIGARNKQVPKDMQYQPIPLTEEWLTRFGFDFNESLSMWKLNDFGIKLNLGYPDKSYVYRFLSTKLKGVQNQFCWIFLVGTRVTYVHELQNAYYTNMSFNELKLKEL